jgi:hypothetical protein
MECICFEVLGTGEEEMTHWLGDNSGCGGSGRKWLEWVDKIQGKEYFRSILRTSKQESPGWTSLFSTEMKCTALHFQLTTIIKASLVRLYNSFSVMTF